MDFGALWWWILAKWLIGEWMSLKFLLKFTFLFHDSSRFSYILFKWRKENPTYQFMLCWKLCHKIDKGISLSVLCFLWVTLFFGFFFSFSWWANFLLRLLWYWIYVCESWWTFRLSTMYCHVFFSCFFSFLIHKNR